MASTQKIRHVVSYENMKPEVLAAFNEKYPKGFSDYLPDIEKYPKPDGTCFYAVTIEISDAIYLVKMNIKTDDVEDIEKWLDAVGNDEDDVDTSHDGGPLPDDNISQYEPSADDSE